MTKYNGTWQNLMMAVVVVITSLLLYHSPVLAATVKPGTVVKSVSGPTLYFVMPTGSIAGIPSPEVYNCLKLSKQNAYKMGQDKIDALKKVPFLARSPEGKLYLIEGTTKRYITSPAVFQKQGYNNADVAAISGDRLDCLTDGKPVK